MFQRFLALASNAFVETIRQPIYGVILLATALLMIFNVSLAAFTLEDDDKLLLDLGLSTLLLSGLFLASFSAGGILGREIENKTVLTVISKPVSRTLFVLGKFVGLLGALVLACYLCDLVFILAVRHGVMQRSSDPWDAPVLVFGFGSLFISIVAAAFCNYFYARNFSTTVLAFVTVLLTLSVVLIGKLDEHWEVIPFASNFVGGQVFLAAYLVMLAIIVTAAVALAASTRFGQLMTLLTSTAVLGMGIASDYAIGRHAGTSHTAAFLYRIIPNVGPFWVVDSLISETRTVVTFQYIGYATTYALLLTGGILSLAIIAFQRREVG